MATTLILPETEAEREARIAAKPQYKPVGDVDPDVDKTARDIVCQGAGIMLPFYPGSIGDDVSVTFKRRALYDLIVTALTAPR